MEAVSSCISRLGDRNMDMEKLLEAFGSSFSFEAIASAYSRARCDVDLAGLFLCESQGTTTTMTNGSKDELDAASILSTDASQSPYTSEENFTGCASKKIVSGTFEGGYARSTVPACGTSRSQLSNVDPNGSFSTSYSSAGRDSNSMREDIEDFMFKMLGDGFQLEMKVIREVLGQCGYDLEKSMEKLVDLSASTLEKSDDVVSRTVERGTTLKIDLSSCPEMSQSTDSSPRSADQNGKESRKGNKAKHDLERQILGALFTAPERIEERPKSTIRQTGVRRSSAFGRPVVEPFKETKIEQTFVSVKPLGGAKQVEDEEDENSFPVLRQAVKEYWAIMEEYFKAAIEAFIKGDEGRAYKLMEEVQFYNRKAREADEKSAQKLQETRDEEMLLDLSTLEPKEAAKLLRVHLSNLAGIPTFHHLKVTLENGELESKRGGPKRLVLKLLEKESIKWTEVENGKTILIRLDEINPKTLSFAKK